MASELHTVCLVICRSGKFETGQGTCSLICMDQLGDPRKKGCAHVIEIHESLAKKIIDALSEYHEWR